MMQKQNKLERFSHAWFFRASLTSASKTKAYSCRVTLVRQSLLIGSWPCSEILEQLEKIFKVKKRDSLLHRSVSEEHRMFQKDYFRLETEKKLSIFSTKTCWPENKFNLTTKFLFNLKNIYRNFALWILIYKYRYTRVCVKVGMYKTSY